MLQEIKINEIEGFCIGNAQDEEAKTGVTVVLCEQGAEGGVYISGGGPASRETPLLHPLSADHPVHAVVLSGGSAFGLAAADGVMRFLEEQGIGFPTGFANVPLVLQSCIYDLGVGRADVRPGHAMGYAACVDAKKNHPRWGQVGAGCGATVGKLRGMEFCSPSGLGIYAVQMEDLQMGAVVAVNALGDVFDHRTGKKIAGLKKSDGTWEDSVQALYRMKQPAHLFTGNTTIGVVVTNGCFDRAQSNKIAVMATQAYARCIRPVGTEADGDSCYALSKGTVQADLNAAGMLAADVMAEAIRRAVCSEERMVSYE